MLNGGAAVSSCERERSRGPGGHAVGDGDSASTSGSPGGRGMVQETRVWEMREGGWKCVHCHTSPSRR
ncbi:unnamed protein product [Laminaria digitata]